MKRLLEGKPAMNHRLLALLVLLVAPAASLEAQDSPADKLQALPDFKIDHVLKADPKVHGSWISMARDNKGRLLLAGQRGQPITRVTIKEGQVVKEEDLKLPVSEGMGMLYAFDSLYINGSGKDNSGRVVFGLFRCRDTKGTDQYDSVEFLREWQGGSGEHGAHGLVLGPDHKLYVVNGNFTGVPKDVLATSPHQNYADDRILPRAEDGNGFGAGHKPPGGYIVRLDPDGKNPELFASGQRNTYDLAFNADGELLAYDSDMEWDWGTPWYRPIRVFHAVSGGDQGFREGSAKWPPSYADSLPAVIDIGIGSPTGVAFGYGAKFPAKYQKAFYVCDWSYGRLSAVHLEPRGSTYAATWEDLVAPKGMKSGGPRVPLNLTDVVVGEDGAIYFTVGGRNTQSHLYRVRYVGSESTAPADLHDKTGAEARAARHAIEAYHAKEDPSALNAVWSKLGDPDRFTRYAARIAVERQPVDSWKARALGESHPQAALTSLLALARMGPGDLQPELFRALSRLPAETLDPALQLDKLRVIEVSVARHGKPADDVAKALSSELGPLYPSKSIALNYELGQVLLALDAPGTVSKTVALLEAAPTLEEQIGYIHNLRTVAKGWTPELRKSYFGWWSKDHTRAQHGAEVVKWFTDAGRGYQDGASLPKFLANFHAQAKATLTPEESQALADVLASYVPPGVKPRKAPAKARAFVKEWKMEDLQPLLDEVGKDRSFERGREVYESAQCLQCHKFGAEGGSVGPELTAVSTRFARRDILESILDPSKVIPEQYQATLIKTTDGRIVDGRIVEEDNQKVVVHPNQLLPDKITIKKSDIEKRQPSKVSPMPANLVNTYSKEEVLDLLAYIESGGKKEHPAYAKTRNAADVTERVAAEVSGNKLTITAGNELFGDPVPGQVKRLRVDYLDGDEPKSKVVNENATLEIRASEGRKLVIKKALYGVIP
jgi:putative heme-binding domain-containing protein